MVAAYLVFLALIATQRLSELLLTRRNTRWCLDRGGLEFGSRHFPVMGVLHGAFLLACATEVICLNRPFRSSLAAIMLSLVVIAQGLRYWSVHALGRRWSARVLVLPGVPAVRSGPYEFIRHPNYLAVVLEGVAIPMIHGAWLTAVVFSLLNAILLSVRIRCEESALAAHCPGAAELARQARFLPVRTAHGH